MGHSVKFSFFLNFLFELRWCAEVGGVVGRSFAFLLADKALAEVWAEQVVNDVNCTYLGSSLVVGLHVKSSQVLTLLLLFNIPIECSSDLGVLRVVQVEELLEGLLKYLVVN